MANPGDEKQPDWIDRIRSEGTIPFIDDNCSNSKGWSSPPGSSFMVRGPEYLTTKVKIPASDYLLQPLGFDWIKSSVKIGEILKHPNSRIRNAIDNEFPCCDDNNNNNKPFVWAFNLQLPSKDNHCAVLYLTNKEPIPKGSLMEKFLKSDDAFRKSRLKLIANIVNGPWIVRKAVGEQAICIIGRSLSCEFCVTDSFIEVDIDVGSSMVATAIVRLAFGYLTNLTVDLAFLIESQNQSELPEKLLGAFRFCNLDPASATTIEPSSFMNNNTLQSSLSKKLWRLLSGSHEDGSSTSSGTAQNGKIVADQKEGQ